MTTTEAQDRPLVIGAEIRNTHRYGFRCGEWASITGFVYVSPPDLPQRLAYAVRYQDGKTDHIAVSESNDHEIRPATA